MNNCIKINTALTSSKNMLEQLLINSKTSYSVDYKHNDGFNINFDDKNLPSIMDNLLCTEFGMVKDMVYTGIINYLKGDK